MRSRSKPLKSRRSHKENRGLKKKGLDAFWRKRGPPEKRARYVVAVGAMNPGRGSRKKRTTETEGVLADYPIRP